jgi:hypothetical protein
MTQDLEGGMVCSVDIETNNLAAAIRSGDI